MACALKRLDKALVEEGVADSRTGAQELIRNGHIRVGGFIVTKPSSMVQSGVKIERVCHEKTWVSRGAYKLLKGLAYWNINPSGSDCIDIGASTGGFTEVLLERGARRVVAVDVGYGQLAWKLRNNEKVTVLEKTNARFLTEEQVGWKADLLVADASFISLRLLVPVLESLIKKNNGKIVVLIKPQFEVGIGKTRKGVVRDPLLHYEVLSDFCAFISQHTRLSVMGITHSPIRGPEGNIEFLSYLAPLSGDRDIIEGEIDRTRLEIESIIAEAHAVFFDMTGKLDEK